MHRNPDGAEMPKIGLVLTFRDNQLELRQNDWLNYINPRSIRQVF